MRVPALPIVASLVLLAAPAFAQNGAMTGTNTDQNGASGYTNNGTGYNTNGYMNNGYNNQQNRSSSGQLGMNNGTGQRWSNSAAITQDTRAKIRQSLTQSGFRDVTVTPEAFVIHAMAPDGSHVVMLLRPDEVTGVVEQTGSSTGGENYHNWNGGNTGSANTNNGAGNNDNANSNVR